MTTPKKKARERKPAYVHPNTGNQNAKKKNPKNATIPQIRCHEHQKKLIGIKARRAKMSVGAYMVRCSIEHDLVPS